MFADDEATCSDKIISKSDPVAESRMETEPVKTASIESSKVGSNQSAEPVKTGSNESAEPVNTASMESDTFEEEEDSLRLFLEPDTEKTESEEDMILSSQKEPAETTINEKTG